MYISTHRGTKEGDLIMGGFAQNSIFTLTEEQLSSYSTILEHTDAEILEWIKYPLKIPHTINSQLIEDIRNFIFIKKLSTVN